MFDFLGIDIRRFFVSISVFHFSDYFETPLVCMLTQHPGLPRGTHIPLPRRYDPSAKSEGMRCSFTNFRGRRMREEKETAMREIDALHVRIRECVDWFFGRVYQPAASRNSVDADLYAESKSALSLSSSITRYTTDCPSATRVC